MNEGSLVLAVGFLEKKEVLRATKDCRAVARKSRRDRSNIVRVRFSVIALGLILGLIQYQTSGFSAWLDRPATVERPFC